MIMDLVQQRSEGFATVLAVGTAVPPQKMSVDYITDLHFKLTNTEHLTELKKKFVKICKWSLNLYIFHLLYIIYLYVIVPLIISLVLYMFTSACLISQLTCMLMCIYIYIVSLLFIYFEGRSYYDQISYNYIFGTDHHTCACYSIYPHIE